MMRRSVKTFFGVGLAALALAVTAAVALPTASLAQTPTATSTATDNHRRGPGGKGMLGGSSEYLAEALGITEDELTAAQEAAQTAAIDKALADGLITQAQADALKNGTELGRGRGGGMLRGLLALGNSEDIDMNALLAEELNITVDELAAARTKAEDLALAAAVEGGRITQEQADLVKARQAFRDYLAGDGVYAQILKQAVDAGAITQAQADALLKAQQNGSGLDGMRGFKGFDGLGGSGGRGHRGGGF